MKAMFYGREEELDALEALWRKQVPAGTSVRATLVYDGDLSPAVEASGFFNALVPVSKLLGL